VIGVTGPVVINVPGIFTPT